MPTETRLAVEDAAQNVRDALVQPATWNESDRSFEVVWTTGAAVTRFDWWDGEFYEETLSVEPGAVRLERLQEGGPVLIDHVGSTQALAGSIVPGSVRIEKGQGIARVRLSGTPDIADIVAKVRDGHLRTVSVGYMVHTYERTASPNGGRDEMRAVDWEPTEISLTPVPADAGAVVRNRSDAMPEIINRDDYQRKGRGHEFRSGTRSRARRTSETQILQACSRAELTRAEERTLLERHEEEPMTEGELYDEITRIVGKRRAIGPIDNAVTTPHYATDTRAIFASVLHARLMGTAPQLPSAAPYAGASLVDMARSLLESQGERVRFARPSAVVDALCRSAQHTTSDFAYILDSAGRRFLIENFGLAQSPLKVLARPRTLPDFKEAHGVHATGPGTLRLVPESAEYKRVTIRESRTSIKLQTYGDIFSISRQALVNDDLGVFQNMALFWARSAANLEADYLTAMINGTGAVLSEDGKPIYHIDHGNLAASGGPISVTTLSAGREAMRTQKDRDGATLSNVIPKYLVVGPAKETEAEQVLASLSPGQVDAVNPFAGKLELIVDARMAGNSWRLFADPALHPVMEFATLEGQEGLFTDTRMGFEVDGVDFKVRTDIGAAATDYRGTYMNPGD